jgi:hypothetical protein
MDQFITSEKPTIEQQIDFVRGARHLCVKGSVQLTETDNAMLLSIEENLVAIKLWNETLTKKLEEGSEVSNV